VSPQAPFPFGLVPSLPQEPPGGRGWDGHEALGGVLGALRDGLMDGAASPRPQCLQRAAKAMALGSAPQGVTGGAACTSVRRGGLVAADVAGVKPGGAEDALGGEGRGAPVEASALLTPRGRGTRRSGARRLGHPSTSLSVTVSGAVAQACSVLPAMAVSLRTSQDRQPSTERTLRHTTGLLTTTWAPKLAVRKRAGGIAHATGRVASCKLRHSLSDITHM
jgi:hypothetical protein